MIGDVLVSAAYIAYLGTFTVSFFFFALSNLWEILFIADYIIHELLDI